MGKIKFSEWIGNEHEFNDHEKYRAAKFREWVDYNEMYKCVEALCSLKYSKSKPKPLQSLPGYPQLGLPAVPPVPSLTDLIGACSEPFEKQLTGSDVKGSQSRLSINKAYVKNFLVPLLNKNDDLLKGIPVTVYNTAGKEYPMTFKIWASKFHVLMRGWKLFCSDHELRKHEDFVTLRMFRHARTTKLCFVISSRKLSALHSSP
jgi:hypothetical protein